MSSGVDEKVALVKPYCCVKDVMGIKGMRLACKKGERFKKRERNKDRIFNFSCAGNKKSLFLEVLIFFPEGRTG